MPKLVLKKRAEVIAEYKLGRKNIVNIGSARGNDITISDKSVSPSHCSVHRKENKYEIKDKNTVAGTKVNDRPITEKDLRYGDIIDIGVFSLVFRPNSYRDAKSAQRASDEDREAEGGPAEGKLHYLLGVYGKFEGKKYEIMQGVTHIGRENVNPRGVRNDIVLTGDMTASKGHAKITCEGSQAMLMDIGSTGGVAVNGEKVGQMNEVPVVNGDEIAIGRTIFRFVDENNEDYSTPKRHGIFLLKIRQPVMAAVTAAVLAFGAVLLYQGLTGITIINSKPKKVDIDINRKWSPDENAMRSAQDEYDISSTPAIGDINGDGKNEVVYLNSSGLLSAWDGKTGKQVWKPVEIFNSGKSSPAICDMNNDGYQDIIVLSDTSMLYIIDGMTGGIIRREMLGGAISELSPAVCDLNGDGKPDIVACSEEGMVHFIYNPGYETGMEKFTEFVEGPLYAPPVVVSTKKISPVVVICSNSSKVYFFDGKERSKKTVDLVEKTGKAHLIAAAPGVGDLDGDGTPELVVQSNVPQYISAIDISRFEVNWTYFVDPTPPAGLKHTASPVVTDANGDGLGDVVVLSGNGKAYVLRGKTGYPTGELLWKMDLPEANRIVSSPAVYDFEKNGIANIVFGGEDGSINVLKNSPGRKEMELTSTVKASNVPITSSPVVGDVNGDGKLEVVYSSILNAVQMLDTGVRTFKNGDFWPMYLGNASRTGELMVKENIRPYILKAGGGGAVFLLLLLVQMMGKMKKISKRPRVAYV